MTKLECIKCCGRYYVFANDINSSVPEDAKPGEAFPSACPLCEDSYYAVLAEEEK